MEFLYACELFTYHSHYTCKKRAFFFIILNSGIYRLGVVLRGTSVEWSCYGVPMEYLYACELFLLDKNTLLILLITGIYRRVWCGVG